MSTRVTLRQVAAAAEVSVSTASLALAGDVRIQPETAARVRAAAIELGYVRDQTQATNAANRFRHGGKPALVAAWVNSPASIPRLRVHAGGMGMSIHHLPRVPLAAQPDRGEAAEPARRVAPASRCRGAPDFTIAPGAPLDRAPALSRYQRIVIDHLQASLPSAEQLAGLGASALIVECRGIDPRPLTSLGVPVVLWSDEGDNPPLCDVVETCEWWTGTSEAIARVRHAGHRRPVGVLIAADPPHWHDDVRAAAFRAQDIPTLVWDHRDASLRTFIQEHRPDAVIGLSVHVLHAMERSGVPLPFAALLTFDDPWHSHCAGWREDYLCQARITLELIQQRLRYGGRPPCRIVVPPLWHAGISLPPAGG